MNLLKTLTWFVFVVGLCFLVCGGAGWFELTIQRLALILVAVLGGGIFWIVAELPKDKQ